MGRYFNKGRGNLPLSLSDGRSVSVPGNSWVTLEGRDETTASVRRAVVKGLLFQQPAPKPTPTKTDSEVKTTAPAEEETLSDTASEESKPTEAAKKVAKKAAKKKTRK